MEDNRLLAEDRPRNVANARRYKVLTEDGIRVIDNMLASKQSGRFFPTKQGFKVQRDTCKTVYEKP